MTDETPSASGLPDGEEGLLRTLEQQIRDTRAKMHELFLQMEHDLCNKLRILREERGWSQAEVVEKLKDLGFEMHQTTLAKLERGKRPLRVAELFAFGQLYGMPAPAIFYMANYEEQPGLEYLNSQLRNMDEWRDQNRKDLLELVEQMTEVTVTIERKRQDYTEAIRKISLEIDNSTPRDNA